MFWLFLLFIVLAYVFAQLGAYAVWFGLFKFGFQLLLIVFAGFAVVALWRKLSGGKSEK